MDERESREPEVMTVLVPKEIYADENITQKFLDFCCEES